MKCTNCGFESAQDSAFCPQCGERMVSEIQPQGSFAAQILPALKDPLFLVVCILLSASCLMSLIAGNVPLLEILAAVFLWLTHAQAHKGIADAEHLRCVSGVVYAGYVINYVAAGLALVVGVLCTVALNIIGNNLDSLLNMFAESLGKEDLGPLLAGFLHAFPSTIILIVCIFIAVMVVVFNIFTYRYLHRFIKSLYQSVEQDVYAVECVKAAKILLFIYGGGSICGSLSVASAYDFRNFFINILGAGWAIVAGLLIRKYLDPEV